MKKNRKLKLGEIYFGDMGTATGGNGLFSYLGEHGVGGVAIYPLVEEFIDDRDGAEFLDLDYFFSYSSEKYISPFMEKIISHVLDTMGYTWEDLYSGKIYDEGDEVTLIFQTFKYNYVADIIYKRFGLKWKKIYDALISSVYDPLHNYDMEEKRTPNLTHTETYNNVQDQRTPNVTTSGSANTKTGIFGFNGTSAKDSALNDGTSSQSVTGTDTNVKTGNISNTETGTDTLTRKGNIGVTTSQQLIESELELRKHDFYRIIYNDIDSILCSKIY